MKTMWVVCFFFSFSLFAQELKNIIIQNAKLIPEFSVSSQQTKGWACLTGEIITNMRWKSSDIEIVANVQGYGTRLYSMTLNLPSSSRKRFFLYISLRLTHREIELSVKKDGQVLDKQEIQLNYNYKNILRIGYFPPKNDHNLFFLKKIEKYNPWVPQSYYNKDLEEIEVINLDSRLLPDRWIGYDNMDVMIMSKEESLLSDRQKAIQEWIYNGGILIVAPQERLWIPGSHFIQTVMNQTFSEDDVSYVDIPDSVKAYLPNVTQMLALQPPGDAIQDKELTNSLWHVYKGAGAILYVGMDLGKESANSSIFWKTHLLPKIRDIIIRKNSWHFLDQGDTKDTRDEYNLSSALNLSFGRMPGIWSILAILVVYLLLVGPVNFIYFRKKNLTLHLVWSIPCLSMLFVTIILIYGYWVRGMNSETLSFHIVQPVEGSDYICHKKYLSLLSSSHSTYNIHLEDNGSLYPLYSNWSLRSSSVMNYNQKQGLMIQDFPLSLWQTGTFYSLYFQGNMNFSVNFSKNSVKIEKPASVRIKKIFGVFNNYNLYYLGDFETPETQKEFFTSNGEHYLLSNDRYNSREIQLAIQKKWNFQNEKMLQFLSNALQKDTLCNFVVALIESPLLSPISLNPGPDISQEIKIFYYKETGKSDANK